MGIDGIGKRGGATGIPGSGAAEGLGGERGKLGGAGETGKAFELNPAGAAGGAEQVQSTANVEGTAAAGAFEQVRSGEMPLDQYLDLKTQDATKGLEGLGPQQLADVQSLLKDQLRTDPSLRELVQRATGAAPTTPEE